MGSGDVEVFRITFGISSHALRQNGCSGLASWQKDWQKDWQKE